jgi:hypothetical protein
MPPAHLARARTEALKGEVSVATLYRRTRPGHGQRAEVRFDGLAGCLRTPKGGSSRQTLMVMGKGQIRTRLMTPREGARLMGLPDSYVLPRSATAGFQVVGDGVAVPVVSWLSQTLLEPLERMRNFPAVSWHVIPGNHDHHRGNGLWDRARALGLPENVRLHLTPELASLGDDAVLLPAPLRPASV